MEASRVRSEGHRGTTEVLLLRDREERQGRKWWLAEFTTHS